MWFANILIGLVLVGSPPWSTDAFNIETKDYAVYRKEEKSMLGFAVSVYRDRAGRGWAIVGAPEAETQQGGVYRGGAVYKCDIAVDDRCSMVNFDPIGNNYVKTPSLQQSLTQIDNKTLQWFGATVSASLKDGGPILACAPRYIWFSVSQTKYDHDTNRRGKESTVGNRRDPVGTCWVVNNDFQEPREYSPCRTKFSGHHRQGSCQAGLGAAMSKDGERIFIGAPGSWYWQGQIYSISTDMKLKFVEPKLFAPEAEASGQAFSRSLNGRSKIMFTKEGPAYEDDSYMGYSVTTGDFVGNGDSGTAIGVPRGADLLGKVILFTSNMTNFRNVTGEQMGAYFGYAVASGDIDGDGSDDLIVGAPMYTIPDNPEMTIETGRVYVIYQGVGPEKFRKVDSRDGESNRGRFGLSLASLGDIDLDGYGDFVVGAPYGGLNGDGAVYIYHGSSTGVLEKYSQVIYAETLDVPVKTFGFSVAGGLDLDGNHYPDLVVGAYESAAAMFFRARPVIKMDSFVSFDLPSKLITLDHKNCTLSDRSRVVCCRLRACFKYSGESVRSMHNFNIQYVLDVKKTKNPRLFFLEFEGKNTMNSTVTVKKDQQICRTVKVYVAPNIRDKLTTLDAEMRMSLEQSDDKNSRPRNPMLPLQPVLGSTTSRKDSLSIRKNCGTDNICIPDLRLNVSSNVFKYLLGSGKRLELDVLVQNMGEDAFEATYNLKLPSGIDYIKVEKIESTEVPVQCSAPKQMNNHTLRCDIGNPLQQYGLVKFKVLLQPVTSHGMKPVYEFSMDVNTTNPENPFTTADNTQILTLPIWIETNLQIDGESKPKDLYYNPDNYTGDANVSTEMEFGPAMTHNYTIRNLGPSDVIEAEAFLIWPAQTLAGDELLYLLEQPETAGPIACDAANANYLSLKLEQRRTYAYHPDPSGIIVVESDSGKTVNVARGFEHDRNKPNLEEESEINTADRSNIQKQSHSSASSSDHSGSDTRKIQITENGDKSVVISKIYTQNSSSSSSENAGSGSRGIFFGVESGGSSGTGSMGGVFTSNEETTLHPGISTVEQSYNTNKFITGDTEETIRGSEFDLQLRNITSSQELERIFGGLSKSSTYQFHNRQGRNLVLFMGRFVTSADRKACIEFQDGSVLPLLNRYGAQSYVSESVEPHDNQFLRLEGELLIDSNGRGFVVLKDGHRFPVQGTFSYTEEHSYTLSNPQRTHQTGRNYESGDYSSSWNEESRRNSDLDREYESRYSSTHEERRTEDRRVSGRVHGRENRATGHGNLARTPHTGPRYRRESDMVEVRAFKKFEKLHRRPRDLENQATLEHELPDRTKFESDPRTEGPDGQCDTAKCVMLRCVLGPLKKDQEVWISSRYRVAARTLKKVAVQEKVRVSTKMVAHVTKQPYIGKPSESVTKSHEIKTNVEPSTIPSVPDVIPLWVVVLSACAGTIILLLLIYLLHKCGFFKRNRPSDAPERQPLNRNGHFHGDDH